MNEFINFLISFANWFMAETQDPWEPAKTLMSPADVCLMAVICIAVAFALVYFLKWLGDRDHAKVQATERRINHAISK